MRYTAPIFLIFGSVAAAFVQSADPPVSFEVASIKASPPPDGMGMRVGCPGDPGRITCTNMSVANLIQMAYGVQRYQLSGLGTEDLGRFEIAVRIPEGASKEQVKLMWQNLLAERFRLAVHREKKEAQVYELTVARGGPKMQESVETPSPASDARPASLTGSAPIPKLVFGKDGFPDLPPGRDSMAMMGNKARWRATNATMQQVATMLGGQLGQPVNDATGLKGKYDFTLSWVTESFSAGRGAVAAGQPEDSPLTGMSESENGPTLFSALQSQLGLKLEQKRGSIEMLVIDHVEKPTEN